jgi:hypothetical protein
MTTVINDEITTIDNAWIERGSRGARASHDAQCDLRRNARASKHDRPS